jgi:hypothetical protein
LSQTIAAVNSSMHVSSRQEKRSGVCHSELVTSEDGSNYTTRERPVHAHHQRRPLHPRERGICVLRPVLDHSSSSSALAFKCW